MKFKLIGTKTTLEPQDKAVVKDYATRPDTYEPADAEARKAAAEHLGTAEEADGDSNDGGA